MEGKYVVYIVWGKRDRVLDELSDYDLNKEEFTDDEIDELVEGFSFETEAELRAFLIGVESASQYSHYYEAPSRELARAYVRRLAEGQYGVREEEADA
jgi:hypothetical protein